MVNAAVVVAVLAGWNWLSADEVEPLESTDVGKSWGGGGGGQPLREGGGGVDMSATFAKYKSCDACIAAGYGWCPLKQKCGGFANRECESAGPALPPPPPRSEKKRKGDQRRGGEALEPSGGTDMRATFAKLRTCTVCIAAGYGWCPIQRKCGGFANRECGEGERYFAEGGADAAPSKASGRNGRWVPKQEREANEQAAKPPAVDLPPASSSPPSGVLHAGPAGSPPPPPPEEAARATVGVEASGAIKVGGLGMELPVLGRAELDAMDRAELVQLVLRHQAVAVLREQQ